MKKPREKHLKGAIHAMLALLAVAEFFSAKSRSRKFFIGTAAGWHFHATWYHLLLEKE